MNDSLEKLVGTAIVGGLVGATTGATIESNASREYSPLRMLGYAAVGAVAVVALAYLDKPSKKKYNS